MQKIVRSWYVEKFLHSCVENSTQLRTIEKVHNLCTKKSTQGFSVQVRNKDLVLLLSRNAPALRRAG